MLVGLLRLLKESTVGVAKMEGSHIFKENELPSIDVKKWYKLASETEM